MVNSAKIPVNGDIIKEVGPFGKDENLDDDDDDEDGLGLDLIA